MALAKPLPCFLVLVIVTTSAATSGLSGSVVKCYQAPPATNSTALFTHVVQPLLGALPSVAASTGFASLQSGGTGRDRAFARALCFGDSTTPAECLRCLSDAASCITAGCGTSRRAGIWTESCFLAYAIGDTNVSSPSLDAFRSRAIISAPEPTSLGSDAERVANASESNLRKLADLARSLAPRAAANGARMLATADATAVASNYASRSTVRVLAQCARDRTPAECLRCVQDSAREVPRCCWGLDPWRGGVTAAVVGFNCFLRFEVATAKVALPELIWLAMKDNLVLSVTVGIVATVVLAAVLAIFVLIIKEKKGKAAIRAYEEEIAALEVDVAQAKMALGRAQAVPAPTSNDLIV